MRKRLVEISTYKREKGKLVPRDKEEVRAERKQVIKKYYNDTGYEEFLTCATRYGVEELIVEMRPCESADAQCSFYCPFYFNSVI